MVSTTDSPVKHPATRISRQACTPVSVDFPVLPDVNFQALRSWLSVYAGVQLQPYQGIALDSLDPVASRIARLGWLTGLLSGTLLRVARIPCLDSGHIARVTVSPRNKQRYQLTFVAPTVDRVDNRLIHQAFHWAGRLVLGYVQHGGPSEALDSLFDETKRRFLDPTTNRMPGTASSVALLRLAYEQGIPFVHLGAGFFALGWGRHMKRFNSSANEFDSAFGARVSQNKHLVSHMLIGRGLPAPQNVLVANADQAVKSADLLGYPVVLKPVDRDRGEGVFVNIDDQALLLERFKEAEKITTPLLLEKQVDGRCHRIVIAGGHYRYCVKRYPRSVIGDGEHSIESLIRRDQQKQSRRAAYWRSKPVALDKLARKTLEREGWDPDNIPDEGQVIALRPTENAAWGVHLEDVSQRIHPDNIQIAMEAARLARLEVCGVDIISSDIAVPWHKNGAIINEVNYSPQWAGSTEGSKKGLVAYLQELFPDQGRVPIKVFIGDEEAMTAARNYQFDSHQSGRASYLSNHVVTQGPQGELLLRFPVDNLFHRCRALLLNDQVEEVVLVVQTDALLSTGLPLDAVDDVKVINHRLVTTDNPEQQAPDASVNSLLQIMHSLSDNQPVIPQ